MGATDDLIKSAGDGLALAAYILLLTLFVVTPIAFAVFFVMAFFGGLILEGFIAMAIIIFVGIGVVSYYGKKGNDEYIEKRDNGEL